MHADKRELDKGHEIIKGCMKRIGIPKAQAVEIMTKASAMARSGEWDNKIKEAPYWSGDTKVIYVENLPEGLDAFRIRSEEDSCLIVVVRELPVVFKEMRKRITEERVFHEQIEEVYESVLKEKLLDARAPQPLSESQLDTINHKAHVLASAEGFYRFYGPDELTPEYRYQLIYTRDVQQLQRIIEEGEADREWHHSVIRDNITHNMDYRDSDIITAIEWVQKAERSLRLNAENLLKRRTVW